MDPGEANNKTLTKTTADAKVFPDTLTEERLGELTS
jgi:hypothetical protein